jgi:hypothetical protein
MNTGEADPDYSFGKQSKNFFKKGFKQLKGIL